MEDLEELYLLWLSRISGLGIKKQDNLLNYFKTGENIFSAHINELILIEGISKNLANKIVASRNLDDTKKYKEFLNKENIKFITKANEKYPILLKEIYDAPLVIYVLGNLPDEKYPKISVIGSRRCTEYGLSIAHKISKDLAKNNIVIVSGMARGIDTQAHLGALNVNGYTIGVLGNGVDICYPAENRAIRERIIEKGCLISEFPPGTKPLPGNFPKRNRIISGLSLGTLVVEAGERSGTLITVDQALEQGREVFAVPGKVNSKLSLGTNSLIQQGATLTSNYEDIVNSLNIKIQETNIKKEELSLTEEEKLIYSFIKDEPITIEEITIKTKSQIFTVQYILTLLELKGAIQKLPGQRYMKKI